MLENIEWLLLGVAIGTIPSAQISSLLIVWLAQRLSVKPKQISEYEDSLNDEAN